MVRQLRWPWLPRVLRWLSLLVAAGLVAMVSLSPHLADTIPPHKLLRLFAQDAVLRRSAIAAAIGLAVSAFIFFKSPPRSPLQSYQAPRGSSPGDVIGA